MDESMTPACAFLRNQLVGTGNTQWGRICILVSVACFNCSIVEVWTANACLTTACLANNCTVAGVKSIGQITTVLLSANNTWRTLDQSNNPIIISSSRTGKKTRPAGSALGIFMSLDPDLCVLGHRILRPWEPWDKAFFFIQNFLTFLANLSMWAIVISQSIMGCQSCSANNLLQKTTPPTPLGQLTWTLVGSTLYWGGDL